MTFGEKLRESRKTSNLTQKQLADKIGAKHNSVSDWENDKNKPDPDTIELLCGILGISPNYLLNSNSDDFSLCEKEIIKKYRALDDHGKDMVDTVLDKETKRIQQFGNLTDTNVITLVEYEASRAASRLLPYWEVGVSAGNGIYQLNDTTSVMLDLWETNLTRQADFIIRISGNSMEPDYHDDDKVLVNRKVNVELGEVGIFVKNGETYIKELGNNELISRNPEYDNIPVHDFDNVVCMGKVIGTVTDSMIAKA